MSSASNEHPLDAARGIGTAVLISLAMWAVLAAIVIGVLAGIHTHHPHTHHRASLTRPHSRRRR